jgi:hypothetical protein
MDVIHEPFVGFRGDSDFQNGVFHMFALAGFGKETNEKVNRETETGGS